MSRDRGTRQINKEVTKYLFSLLSTNLARQLEIENHWNEPCYGELSYFAPVRICKSLEFEQEMMLPYPSMLTKIKEPCS